MNDVSESRRELIYFTHMPKCGGQSFKKSLEIAYAERVQFVYIIPLPIAFRKQVHFKLWRLKNKISPIQIRDDAEIVYGHVCFDDLPEMHNCDIKYGAFFRDPLDWVVSFYFYTKRKYPKEFGKGLVDAIKKYDLGHGFRRYIGNKKVSDLNFVGLQANYSASLKLYKELFQRELSQFHMNILEDRPEPGVTVRSGYKEFLAREGLLEEVAGLMADNFRLYDEAVERHNVLLKQYGLDHEFSAA